MFELFGLDFLVDSDLNPWLLEVNSTPSMAVDHADPSVQQMIFVQKASMVADMLRLVRVPARFLHPHPLRAAPPRQTRPMTHEAVLPEAPHQVHSVLGWAGASHLRQWPHVSTPQPWGPCSLRMCPWTWPPAPPHSAKTGLHPPALVHQRQ